MLDGFDQRDYLEGKSDTSARNTFFYYADATPSAVRYKNWKFYFTMAGSTGADALNPPISYHWTQIDNIRRDPFEQAVGDGQKSILSYGGALDAPTTAYLYDWNMLPIGQLLWMKELETYMMFPPLQAPETYNLDGVLKAMQESQHQSN